MCSHVVVGRIDVGLVAAGLVHARLQIVGDQQVRRAAEEGEGADMGADPIRQALRPRGLGKGVVAGAKHGHKDLGLANLAAERVLDGKGLAGVVDESLFPGQMDLAHGWLEFADEGAVAVTETTVLQAVRMLRLVLLPEQKQGHGASFALNVNVGPVRLWPLHSARRQGRKEQALNIRVGQAGRQRPTYIGRPRSTQILDCGVV